MQSPAYPISKHLWLFISVSGIIISVLVWVTSAVRSFIWILSNKNVYFSGGRTADTIITWLKKKTGPAYQTLASAEDLEKFKADNKVCVVAHIQVSSHIVTVQQLFYVWPLEFVWKWVCTRKINDSFKDSLFDTLNSTISRKNKKLPMTNIPF